MGTNQFSQYQAMFMYKPKQIATKNEGYMRTAISEVFVCMNGRFLWSGRYWVTKVQAIRI